LIVFNCFPAIGFNYIQVSVVVVLTWKKARLVNAHQPINITSNASSARSVIFRKSAQQFDRK